MQFGGINTEITLRPHQRDAIVRILYGWNTLLAHEFGVGKTYEMVAAAMESKRIGLSHKSLFGGWNIKAYLICQDKAQLDAAYGKEESITSNCHVTVAYAPNKVETAKYLSDRLGVTTVIKRQESISFQGGVGLFATKSVAKSQQEVQRAVLTPDEIMRLSARV